jgi:hypothetical protein
LLEAIATQFPPYPLVHAICLIFSFAVYALGRDAEFAVQQQPMAEELAFPDR